MYLYGHEHAYAFRMHIRTWHTRLYIRDSILHTHTNAYIHMLTQDLRLRRCLEATPRYVYARSVYIVALRLLFKRLVQDFMHIYASYKKSMRGAHICVFSVYSLSSKTSPGCVDMFFFVFSVCFVLEVDIFLRGNL